MRSFGSKSLLLALSLSVALNHYFCGRLADSALILPDRDELTQRANSNFGASLDAIHHRSEASDDLAFLRVFVAAELQASASS